MFHLTIKMMQSLNGFIAQTQNDNLKWGSSADKKLYKKISTEYGTVIVGKNTYLQMPKTAFKSRQTVVVVRNIDNFVEENKLNYLEILTFNDIKFAIDNNITFIESEPKTIIKYLESIGKNKALLVGGGIINNLFLQAGVVNELQITIAPKIFGSGIPIFGYESIDLDLELQSFDKISNNELLLTYKILN